MRGSFMRASAVVGAVLLMSSMPAGAIAQSGEATAAPTSAPAPGTDLEPLYATTDGATVYADTDWCDLFTEGGSLMTIETCLTQVAALMGDPGERRLPQALVPDDPVPAGKRVTKKGKDDLETKSFWMADGTYKAKITHKRCAGEPSAFLLPVGEQALVIPRLVSSGSYIHDLDAGKYTLQVLGLPKDLLGKPCSWKVVLTPSEG